MPKEPQARPPAKDQGRRGTCVAFAVTAGHELARAEGTDLSAEFLHWAAKQRDGFPRTTEGTTIAAAIRALGEAGQPPESLWPYSADRDARAADYAPPANALVAASLRRFSGATAISKASGRVRDALDRGMVVALGIRLYATWYYPAADGRIAMPQSGAVALGGHAVLVVGHDDRAGAGDYFTIRNSWGSPWADGGYAALPSDYIDAHIVEAWGLPVGGGAHGASD